MLRMSRMAGGCVLGVVLVAAVTLPTGTASANARNTSASPHRAAAGTSCAQVLFVGARGSGESGPGTPGWNGQDDGLGSEVHSLYAAFVQDLANQRTVQMVSVTYDPLPATALLNVTDESQYFANLGAGVDSADTTLTQQAATCPHQRIVLAGYSQGAMVMHRVLRELGTAILSRVSAAVLIADGDRVPFDHVTSYGTAPRSTGGVGLALPALSGSLTTKFTAKVGSRVLSICTRGDIVCDDYPLLTNLNAAGIAIHLLYAGSQPVLDAALQAAQMVDAWKTANMPLPANGDPNRDHYLSSIACPSVTSCVAVGNYTTSAGSVGVHQGLLVTGSGTSWKWTVAPVPANGVAADGAYLTSVACASATSCVAVGYYFDSSGNRLGMLLTGSGTSWTATEALLPPDAQPDQQVFLSTVTCPSATTCVALGTYSGGSGLMAVTGSGTSWTADEVAYSGGNPTIASLACPATTTCVAVGSTGISPTQGLLVTGSGTSWTAVNAPLPANADLTVDAGLTGVACPSATSCVAVGNYYVSGGTGGPAGLVLAESGTSWNPTEAPVPGNASPGSDAGLNSVACPSTTSCAAVGSYGSPDGSQGLLLTGSGTAWTPTEAPLPTNALTPSRANLESMACPSTTKCVATGSYAAAIGFGFPEGLVVTGSGTSWTAAEAPLPPSGTDNQQVDLNALACPSTTSCVATGDYVVGSLAGLLATGAP
jgi:hypothetical protein